MIYEFLFLLLGLVAINLYLEKSILYPPALFSAVWAAALLGLIVWEKRFYPISNQSLLVFSMGAVALTIGGVIARSFRVASARRTSLGMPSPSRRHYVRKLLDWGLAISILGLPLYWQKAVASSVYSGRSGFLAGIRQQTILAEETSTSIDFLDNFVLLSLLLAPIIFLEDDGTRKARIRTVVAISLAMSYGVLTASKAVPVHLALILLAVHWLKRGRPPFWSFVLIGAVCMTLFIAGLIFINLADLNIYSPLDLTNSALDVIPNYMFGGLVAFDRVLIGESLVQNTQGVLRGFWGIARKLGANIDLPTIHAEYTNISNYENTNIYTIYFSYINDLSVLGTAIWMTVLGIVLTYFYRAVAERDPVVIIMYAMIVDAIVFSIHAEHFLLGISQYAKALALLAILYRLPQLKIR